MNKKKILYIAAPVLIALLGLCWYFLYFVNTPSYAINKAREAYQKHDLPTFKRYVDTRAVMDSAFDDLLIAEDKINNTKLFSNSFALGIVKLLKPTVVDLMERDLENRIISDSSKSTPNANSKPKREVQDPITEAMEKNMSRRFPADSLTLKDIKISSREKNQAVCTIVVFNKNTNKNHNIELLMHVNNSDEWQVYKTKNLVEFIIENEQAQK